MIPTISGNLLLARSKPRTDNHIEFCSRQRTVTSVEFERSLELLLKILAAQGRTVVMFKLPLLPNRISYGRIQRQLASKCGVWLIPKRCLTAVLGDANATLDGLHLSQEGARQMTLLVERVLSPVLKSP